MTSNLYDCLLYFAMFLWSVVFVLTWMFYLVYVQGSIEYTYDRYLKEEADIGVK